MSEIGPKSQIPDFNFFVSRVDAEVHPLEKQGWEAQKIAQDFARLGLSSALLLNGGALLALPPLMQWLPHDARTQIAIHAIWFLCGIGATSLAIITAYVNWMWGKEQQYGYAEKRGRELECEFLQKATLGDPKWERAAALIVRLDRKIVFSQSAAALFAVLGFAFFGFGTFQFIHLAATNAIGPNEAGSDAGPQATYLNLKLGMPMAKVFYVLGRPTTVSSPEGPRPKDVIGNPSVETEAISTGDEKNYLTWEYGKLGRFSLNFDAKSKRLTKIQCFDLSSVTTDKNLYAQLYGTTKCPAFLGVTTGISGSEVIRLLGKPDTNSATSPGKELTYARTGAVISLIANRVTGMGLDQDAK